MGGAPSAHPRSLPVRPGRRSAWRLAQDPYLKSEEFGHTIDEVENLIKKHEAFEKAAAAQEDRFSALERLTTFELKDMKRRQDEDMMRQQDLIEKQKQASLDRRSRDIPDTKSESGSIKESTMLSRRSSTASE